MDTEKPCILIIDDDIAMMDVVERILKTQSYQVFKAASGQEGLTKAHEVMPDLILLDIMMPNMNGYEVCERLKSNPRTAEIPVLILSALGNTGVAAGHSFFADENDRLRGYEAGAEEFLNKPIRLAELLERVEFWTGNIDSFDELVAEVTESHHANVKAPINDHDSEDEV